MKLPNKVRICECWARDGIQGESKFIPTEKKIEQINRMIAIGFKRLEVTSFSHPKLVPQFADSLEVLKGVNRQDGVSFIAIVPNDKALDRLMEAGDKGYGVHEITAIISASEDHLLANLEKNFQEAKPPLANIIKRARKGGLRVIGCIGTSFGCPLAGDVPLEKVIELTDWYLQHGTTSIMLGDTTGEANPKQVREVYAKMLDLFPNVDFIAHFHDTRGMGLANTLAALQEGIVYHDSAIGGIGGQPATRRPKYHRGLAGNVCTEDMVSMLDEMGIETGLEIQDVLELARAAEGICGRNLKGHVTRSGPVRHKSQKILSPSVLRIGQEIPPSLFLYEADAERKASDSKLLAEIVIRDALEKNWSLPSNLTINLTEVKTKDLPEGRSVLVTRFDVMQIMPSRTVFDVMSQKSNGDVYLEGHVIIDFK